MESSPADRAVRCRDRWGSSATNALAHQYRNTEIHKYTVRGAIKKQNWFFFNITATLSSCINSTATWEV